jgi:GT2 family glycosyltransferase
MTLDLSIIIVNWHSQEYLKKCIASILANTRRTSFEIIVIDSASFDGCERMLREHYPQVRFVQSCANLGFARSNNRAFEMSIGESLLFLNPDTELAGPAIDTMHARLKALPAAGIVGCRLLNADGTVQSSCIQSIPTIANQLLDSEALRARWPKSRLWGMAPLHEGSAQASEVEAVSGACLMLRRTTFERVGRFSAEYFMYAEDMDLAYQVREAGYINYYVPDASVIHYGGSSSERAASAFSAVMMPEAVYRFLRKTRGTAYSLGYRLAMFVAAVGRIAFLTVGSFLSGGDSREASTRKWRAILLWALHKDDIVKRHYPENRVDAS